jgi:DNA-binding NtrC family response regulator
VTGEAERRKIEITLSECGADSQKAADLLQVSPRLLAQKLKEYGMTPAAAR